MKREINSRFAIIFLITIFVVIFGYIIFLSEYIPLPFLTHISLPTSKPIPTSTPSSLPPLTPAPEIKDIKKFSSEEEFKVYLQETSLGYLGGFAMGGGIGGARIGLDAPVALEVEEAGASFAPERISETTVQVLGIDEPDIVKTDGKEIYFSPRAAYYWRQSWEIIPPKTIGETKVVKAFPPEDLSLESKIDKRGNLLLQENILVIFSDNNIYGYDVSDPKTPEQKWKMDLEEENYIVEARLYKGKIYLITRTRIDPYHPCPIRPLSINGTPLTIGCAEIYHPTTNIPADVTYTAMVFDPASGETEKTISFIGTYNSSVVYMSENAIYVTYSYYGDFIRFYYNFFNEKCEDIIPAFVVNKLEKLMGYDISDTSKFTEFQIILESYYNTLNVDERLRVRNELTNRMEDYYKVHKRELEKTGLIKIGLDKFEIVASGNVPGIALNQFSLDEYKGYLRIAVTVGRGWGIFGGMGESANDVYVLDKDLRTVGSVKDLGLGERIYSVRFIEDKGYLVTFKQIDPFFVLDLSNPQNPELKGELKIPGYSSYLHPITKDKILGIGKEGSKVKISLFDVKDPENPTEKSKYTLDEYWSDILNTHHAFLLDKKHQIFFLPGGKGGYIFSYKDNQLALERADSGTGVRRAIYIDDYLYIIADNKITVLNELNWEDVSMVEF